MGKYSNFNRRPRDQYDTPAGIVPPVKQRMRFVEPCVGWGQLVESLTMEGHECTLAFDIEPERSLWKWGYGNALEMTEAHCAGATHICTNPVWAVPLLHEMIDHFRVLRPTWLLFYANWIFTKQARPLLEFCQEIHAVGRVSWMENGQAGKEDSSWYLFGEEPCETVFHGRVA